MMTAPRLAVLFLAVVALAGCNFRVPGVKAVQRPKGPSPLAQWSAVVVGADSSTSDNQPTPMFDNARRDVAAAFQKAGFAPANMAQLSVNPGTDAGVMQTSPQAFTQAGGQTMPRGTGCLFYFTSHGSRSGIRFGPAQLDPATMDRMISGWCGEKPTVVIISACFSGVFVPVVARPGRMVMTAARPDRSSFGCGGDDRYPYFDACVLESLPRSINFLQLADVTRACVTRREAETGSAPASEPQVLIGDQIRPVLNGLPFTAPPS